MSLANYNSHLQAPELMKVDGEIKETRQKQTLSQLVQNERGIFS